MKTEFYKSDLNLISWLYQMCLSLKIGLDLKLSFTSLKCDT